MSSGMKCGIERFSRLKDAEGDMDKLTHHGAEDKHGRFSDLSQEEWEDRRFIYATNFSA